MSVKGLVDPRQQAVLHIVHHVGQPLPSRFGLLHHHRDDEQYQAHHNGDGEQSHQHRRQAATYFAAGQFIDQWIEDIRQNGGGDKRR